MDAESSTSHGGDTDGLGQTPRRLFVNDTISESPKTPGHTVINETVGALTDNPSHNPDKLLDEEDVPAHLTPADPTGGAPAVELVPTTTHDGQAAEKGMEAGKSSGMKTPATIKEVQDESSRGTTISKKRAGKSSNIKQDKPTSTTSDTKLTTKTSLDQTVKKTVAAGPKTPIASPAEKRPSSQAVESPNTTLGRPKPKASSKPDKVPASAVAPTVSSIPKHDNSRLLSSRQSVIRQSPKLVERSSSRMSVSKQAEGPARTIRRQASTINQSRPSVGPPPKKAQERQAPKRGNPVDQDFLARMMRPTQSSSSKTSEKAPVTPPRKTNVQRLSPATRLAKPRAESNAKALPRSSTGSVTDVAVNQEATRSTMDSSSPISNVKIGNDGVKPVEGLSGHSNANKETQPPGSCGASQDLTSLSHTQDDNDGASFTGDGIITAENIGSAPKDTSGTTMTPPNPVEEPDMGKTGGAVTSNDQSVALGQTGSGDVLPNSSSQDAEESEAAEQMTDQPDMSPKPEHESLVIHDESKDSARASNGGELLDTTQSGRNGTLRSSPSPDRSVPI